MGNGIVAIALLATLVLGTGASRGQVETRRLEYQPIVAAEQARSGPCRIHWDYRPHPKHRDEITGAVKRLIRCATRRWKVEGGAAKALSVADCESGFFYAAVSPTGEYLGVFQLGRSEFRSNQTQHWRDWFAGNPGRFQPRANVLAGILMAHRHGWGAWSCAS